MSEKEEDGRSGFEGLWIEGGSLQVTPKLKVLLETYR